MRGGFLMPLAQAQDRGSHVHRDTAHIIWCTLRAWRDTFAKSQVRTTTTTKGSTRLHCTVANFSQSLTGWLPCQLNSLVPPHGGAGAPAPLVARTRADDLAHGPGRGLSSLLRKFPVDAQGEEGARPRRVRSLSGTEDFQVAEHVAARALWCRCWLSRLWRMLRPTWWTPPPSDSSRLLRWWPEVRERRRRTPAQNRRIAEMCAELMASRSSQPGGRKRKKRRKKKAPQNSSSSGVRILRCGPTSLWSCWCFSSSPSRTRSLRRPRSRSSTDSRISRYAVVTGTHSANCAAYVVVPLVQFLVWLVVRPSLRNDRSHGCPFIPAYIGRAPCRLRQWHGQGWFCLSTWYANLQTSRRGSRSRPPPRPTHTPTTPTTHTHTLEKIASPWHLWARGEENIPRIFSSAWGWVRFAPGNLPS